MVFKYSYFCSFVKDYLCGHRMTEMMAGYFSTGPGHLSMSNVSWTSNAVPSQFPSMKTSRRRLRRQRDDLSPA